MRDHWLTAPWWVRGLVFGSAWIAFVLLLILLTGRPPGPNVPWVLGYGVVTGLVTGLQGARRNRRLRQLAGSDRAADIAAARRAAWRGPVPADPAVREAAIRIAEDQVDELGEKRVPLVFLLLLVFVGDVVLALTYRPWLWLIAASVAVLLIWLLHAPEWYARRADELRDPEHIRW